MVNSKEEFWRTRRVFWESLDFCTVLERRCGRCATRNSLGRFDAVTSIPFSWIDYSVYMVVAASMSPILFGRCAFHRSMKFLLTLVLIFVSCWVTAVYTGQFNHHKTLPRANMTSCVCSALLSGWRRQQQHRRVTFNSHLQGQRKNWKLFRKAKLCALSI